MAKVLIVDDDKDISNLIKLILKKESIDSSIINDPLLVIDDLSKNNYDLVLLDIMMPNLSGVELCAKIRDSLNIPIIFISAKRDIVDKMVGYEVGGDDYITKPFTNEELLLKIKSHIRLNNRVRKHENTNLLKNGNLTLNKDTFEVKIDNNIINLTTREIELLKYFMENIGIALSKEQIFEHVWGYDYGDIGTVAVNIKSLRTKLKDNNKYIITIWGYGYKMVEVYES